MENDEVKVIPWIAHEAEAARMERTNRRLWVLCIIIFAALVLTNAGWIRYESQFEEVVISQEGAADNGSDLTLSGVGSGTINNYGGESKTDNQDTKTENGR